MSETLRGLMAVRGALAARRALALVLGAVAVVGLVAAAAAVAARLGLFTALRWGPLALWLAALGGAAALGKALLGLAAPSGPRLRETAALVEAELALRRGALVGLVDLAGGAPAGTSQALLASAAARLQRALPPPVAPTWVPEAWRRLSRRIRAGALASAAALGAAAVSFWYAGDAAAGLVSPLRALRAAARLRVEISLSARTVKRGGDVVVTVKSTAPGRPALHLRSTGESWRPVLLTADASGLAAYRLRDIRAPLFVFASVGAAVSDTQRVAVIEPPFVADFSVTARYPAYLERSDEMLAPDVGPLVLPVGTVLAVRGAASAPLKSAALAAGADRVTLRAEGARFGGELVVRGTATWKLALTDRLGDSIPEPLPSLEVSAVPDSAPVVTVPVPGADTTAPLDLKPAVVVDARDDHGLARVEIASWRVSRLGIVGDTVLDTLEGVNGADRVVQSRAMDLTQRGLLPGDTLRYVVRAWDRAPVPHLGTSRSYAFRLRTLAELREAVRAGADSLAREAATVAGDQSALTRQTQDLAAQRNRSGDRQTAANQPPQTGSGEWARESQGTVPFEQAEEARRVAERQQQLAARVESLQTELRRLARAAEEAGLNDPAWQQRLRDLSELMRQAITPELAQRLEELRRALERLDPRAVQEALRRLTEEQRRIRQELERSAELFERAAIEGSMQTYAQNAEQLRQAETQWAQRAPERRDSADAAREQRDLKGDADSLRQGLERLAERLRQRGDTGAAEVVDSSSSSVQASEQEMSQAASEMDRGQRRQAGEDADRAAQQLARVPQRLREQQQQLSTGWRMEVLRAMDNARDETISLALEEERLARQLRRGDGSADARGRQSAMEQGVQQVVRRLQQAAGRNALVSPRLGASLGQAREQMEQARQALEGPSPMPGEAADRAQDAAQSLSQAAFQLLRNREQVAGSQSGSGFAEAVQRMAQLAGQQGQLNDQLGGLIPLLGNGQDAVMEQLRQLAARQRGLANELERLGNQGLPGRPEQLAEEARQLAQRMEQGRLDRATLERQQRLFRRMLDAGRTLRNDNDDEEPERKSTTAQERAPRLPAGAAPREAALRYPIPTWNALKGLSPAERAMVLDYFRRLNGTNR